MVKLLISAKTGGDMREFGKPLDGELTAGIKALFDYSESARSLQAHIFPASEDLILIERLRSILELNSKEGIPHLTRALGESEASVSFLTREEASEAHYELMLTICHYNSYEPGGEWYGIWGAKLMYIFPTPPDDLYNQSGFVCFSGAELKKGFHGSSVPVKDNTVGRAQAYVEINDFRRGDLFADSLDLKGKLQKVVEDFWKRLTAKKEPALV